MKFLFDQNLSYKLKTSLEVEYPGSLHVGRLGLDKSNDFEIWEYAKANSFTIVSQDADFFNIMIIRGFPPKIIWIKKGNTSTESILQSLRKLASEIMGFHNDSERGCLEIY